MKKKMLICLMMGVLLLTGCSKKEEVKEIAVEEEVKVVEESKREEVAEEEIVDYDDLISKDYTDEKGNRIVEYKDGYVSRLLSEGELGIVRKPSASDFSNRDGMKGPLTQLPNKEGTEFNHDLRSRDLSKLDLKNELDYLMTADFDDDTKWPENLPSDYDLEKIKAYGMDPGLGVRDLHKEGITGRGVGLAIIDQELLVDHVEYVDNLKLYEELHIPSDSENAPMHGPAVTSIAVGKNVGVAPGASLYYIASYQGVFTDDGFKEDMYWFAKSIDRIVEINKDLPKDEKIRVVSISSNWGEKVKNYEALEEAMDRAMEENIYVLYVPDVVGAGRNIFEDPNVPESFKKGFFWRDTPKNEFFEGVMVPMDSRCIASPTGKDKYVFYHSGGKSWSVPYEAGLYALCCQVNPEITPIEYEEAMDKTAHILTLDGEEYKMVNPRALIEEIRK